jgi:uncharacterized protein YabN with tetrapyrrole methylase and pyrophosphatase domain
MDVTAAAGKRKPDPQGTVSVSVFLTNENTGETETRGVEILGGPTIVTELKERLGIDPASSLWVIDKHNKKKQLADHERHNVKEGDRYEGIARGGVS